MQGVRITDGTHQPPPTTASGVPFIGIRNIVETRIEWSTVDKWVSSETHHLLTAVCGPSMGDVLYTAVGATFGRAVEVRTDAPFVFQRHIALVKLVGSIIRPGFAEASLNAPRVFAQAQRTARGAAQPTVTLGELARLVFPLTPMEEQSVVVDTLATALARIDALNLVLRSMSQLVPVHGLRAGCRVVGPFPTM